MDLAVAVIDSDWGLAGETVILKGGGEPALVAFRKEVAAARRGRTTHETSPSGDHQANARLEILADQILGGNFRKPAQVFFFFQKATDFAEKRSNRTGNALQHVPEGWCCVGGTRGALLRRRRRAAANPPPLCSGCWSALC